MDDEDYEQLVAEVRRQGRICKPIVVRPVDDHYEISDGAHNYRAARDVGLTEVLCEIVENMNETEARIQTFMRNQHGTHDPLLEGFMFAGILDSDDNVSNRQLAERLGTSEGKIRRSLKYVEVYEMRRRYAETKNGEPLDSDDDDSVRESVSTLKLRDVDDYFKLPDVFRDRWFDALRPAFVSKRLRDSNPEAAGEFALALERLVAAGIAAATPSTVLKFGESYDWMLAVDEWLQERTSIEDLEEYVVCCAPWLLSIKFLDILPCRYQDDAGEVVMPLDAWSEYVSAACQRYADEDDRYSAISSRVFEWLREKGVNRSDVCGLETARLINELNDAPEVLRNARFLAVDERVALFREVGQEPRELATAALQAVLSEVQARRTDDDGESIAPVPAGLSVVDVFRAKLRNLQRDGLIACEDEFFGDSDKIASRLKGWLNDGKELCGDLIGERPAVDVLEERLESLAMPELTLLAAVIDDNPVVPSKKRWIDAVKAEVSSDAKN
tara:strand:- start:29684 stop:31183 length:1500 start_codon:yes stop_codon:yes gene_type:complete